MDNLNIPCHVHVSMRHGVRTIIIYIYQVATTLQPFLPERVTMPSGNDISIVR